MGGTRQLSTLLARSGAAVIGPPVVAPRAWSPCEVAQSIAHEINQPLAAIALQAGAARRWLNRAEPDIAQALDALEQIVQASARANDIVRSLQRLVQQQPVHAQAVGVDATLRQSLAQLGCALRLHGIEVRLQLELDDADSGLTIQANRAQLQQVTTNLLTNAIEALARVADQPRTIWLSSRRLGATMVEIVVADNGPGVPAPDRPHIFDARFSTKPHGTGLGLSISLAIAEAHGGVLDYQPYQPQGALFRLVLPL